MFISAIAVYHSEMSRQAEAIALKKELSRKAAEYYLSAAEAYPEDDEMHFCKLQSV